MPSKKNSSVILLLLGVGMVSALMVAVQSFSPSSCTRRQHFVPLSSTIKEHSATTILCKSKPFTSTMLAAKSTSGDGGKKKRRRKRKQAPTAATTETPSVEVESGGSFEDEEINVADIKGVAGFDFGGPGSIGESPQTIDESTGSAPADDGSLPLPDIKDILRQKQGDSNKGYIEEDMLKKKKINRNDRTALLKVRYCT